jgi:hypothetical protein
VVPARIATTGTGSFASICVLLLTTGLIALLLLNTALAQGSLELGKLQRESAVLAETAGDYQEQIDRASASGALAKKASQLGMVRANERGYIDLRSGKVTGTAYPASSAHAVKVVTSPTPVPKRAKPKPSKAAEVPATSGAAAATPTAAGSAPSPTAPATLAPTTAAPTPSATSPSPRPTQSSQPAQSPQPTSAR